MLAASTPVWTIIGGIGGAIVTVVSIPLVLINTDNAWEKLRAGRVKKGRKP